MARLILGLLAVAALCMAPLGMAGSHASGAPAQGHHSAVVGQCGELPLPDDSSKQDRIDCFMTCAALPADADCSIAASFWPKAARVAAEARSFDEIVPETAVPPPRLS